MIDLNYFQRYRSFSLDEYKRYQLNRLKTFYKTLQQSSPFYNKIIDKDTINSYEEFEALPFLTQEILRNTSYDELRAVPWRLITSVTRSSGSTGKSKLVLWSQSASQEEQEWGSFGYLIQGVQPTDRVAILMPFEMSRIYSHCQVLIFSTTFSKTFSS